MNTSKENKDDTVLAARQEALLDIAAWHQARARLMGRRPGFNSPAAKEAEEARKEEHELAARYLLQLPELEERKSEIAELGCDAATVAFQVLYERPLGETNAEFLIRAEELIQAAIDAGKAQAIQAEPGLDAGLPPAWRLEKLELYKSGDERFKATFWRQGGKTVIGLGKTPREAAEAGKRLIIDKKTDDETF